MNQQTENKIKYILQGQSLSSQIQRGGGWHLPGNLTLDTAQEQRAMEDHWGLRGMVAGAGLELALLLSCQEKRGLIKSGRQLPHWVLYHSHFLFLEGKENCHKNN